MGQSSDSSDSEGEEPMDWDVFRDAEILQQLRRVLRPSDSESLHSDDETVGQDNVIQSSDTESLHSDDETVSQHDEHKQVAPLPPTTFRKVPRGRILRKIIGIKDLRHFIPITIKDPAGNENRGKKAERLYREKMNIRQKAQQMGFRILENDLLFNSVAKNDMTTVHYILQTKVVDLLCWNARGQTVLHLAVRAGNSRMVYTLLHAAQEIHIKGQSVSRVLVRTPNVYRQTPILIAAGLPTSDILKRLMLEETKCGKYRDEFMNTPLHIAAASGNFGNVNILTNHNVSRNVRNKANMTAFDIAEKLGYGAKMLDLLRPLRTEGKKGKKRGGRRRYRKGKPVLPSLFGYEARNLGNNYVLTPSEGSDDEIFIPTFRDKGKLRSPDSIIPSLQRLKKKKKKRNAKPASLSNKAKSDNLEKSNTRRTCGCGGPSFTENAPNVRARGGEKVMTATAEVPTTKAKNRSFVEANLSAVSQMESEFESDIECIVDELEDEDDESDTDSDQWEILSDTDSLDEFLEFLFDDTDEKRLSVQMYLQERSFQFVSVPFLSVLTYDLNRTERFCKKVADFYIPSNLPPMELCYAEPLLLFSKRMLLTHYYEFIIKFLIPRYSPGFTSTYDVDLMHKPMYYNICDTASRKPKLASLFKRRVVRKRACANKPLKNAKTRSGAQFKPGSLRARRKVINMERKFKRRDERMASMNTFCPTNAVLNSKLPNSSILYAQTDFNSNEKETEVLSGFPTQSIYHILNEPSTTDENVFEQSSLDTETASHQKIKDQNEMQKVLEMPSTSFQVSLEQMSSCRDIHYEADPFKADDNVLADYRSFLSDFLKDRSYYEWRVPASDEEENQKSSHPTMFMSSSSSGSSSEDESDGIKLPAICGYCSARHRRKRNNQETPKKKDSSFHRVMTEETSDSKKSTTDVSPANLSAAINASGKRKRNRKRNKRRNKKKQDSSQDFISLPSTSKEDNACKIPLKSSHVNTQNETPRLSKANEASSSRTNKDAKSACCSPKKKTIGDSPPKSNAGQKVQLQVDSKSKEKPNEKGADKEQLRDDEGKPQASKKKRPQKRKTFGRRKTRGSQSLAASLREPPWVPAPYVMVGSIDDVD